MKVRTALAKATRLVHFGMPGDVGHVHTYFGNGVSITATRIDAAGTGSGAIILDHRGKEYALFAVALPAGTWDLDTP